MRELSAAAVTEAVARLCIAANTRLTEDVTAAVAPARPGGLPGLAGGKRVRRQVNPRRGTEKSGESAGDPADSPFHFRALYADTQ